MAIKGQLFVIAAPSGAGKTSLIQALVQDTENIQVSVSHTTRPCRPNEQEGVDYFYIDDKEFNTMVQKGIFLEHAPVFGYQYGTSKSWIEKRLAEGLDLILELDWQGARQIKEVYPDDCVTVYILPPSKEALLERLKKRAQDKTEVIEYRMGRVAAEVEHCSEFDYLVVNERFDLALIDLKTIVRAQRLHAKFQQERYAQLIRNLLASPGKVE